MSALRIPGSYRDPSSHVYNGKSGLYRGMRGITAKHIKTLLSSSFYQNSSDLIETEVVTEAELLNGGFSKEKIRQYDLWVQHHRLDFITFPYEWSFALLKKAACFHLDLQISGLEHGFQIKDASAYNIQFIGTSPVFIDLPSFIPYEDGTPWAAYKQFCEHFLAPLVLHDRLGLDVSKLFRSHPDGIDIVTASRVLPKSSYFSMAILGHIHLQARAARGVSSTTDRMTTSKRHITIKKQNLVSLLESLRNFISTLTSAGATYWRAYEQKNSYSDQSMEEKNQMIADFAQDLNISTMIDLGCNAGKFSEIALKNGVDHILGLDIDSGAIDIAIERFASSSHSFTPIVFDMANPSPALGWDLKERASIYDRLPKVNGLICLALIHHLVIARNIPMNEFIDNVLRLAPLGIIEFVTKEDPMVRGLLANRDDIFDDYTPAHFKACFKGKAKLIQIESSNETRRFYRYEILH